MTQSTSVIWNNMPKQNNQRKKIHLTIYFKVKLDIILELCPGLDNQCLSLPSSPYLIDNWFDAIL